MCRHVNDLLDNILYITSGVPSVQFQMHKQIEEKKAVVALSINCNNIVIAMCFEVIHIMNTVSHSLHN